MRHPLYFMAVSLVALVTLSGCNTHVEKPYQNVQVVTPGLEGADCILKSKNRQYRAVTPVTLMIERSDETLYVTCTKANYKTATQSVPSKISMWRSSYNVVNGVVPGTAWDIANNSIYAFPDVISVPMEFDQAAYDAAHDDPRRIPVPMQKKTFPEAELEPAPVTSQGDKAFDGSLHK